MIQTAYCHEDRRLEPISGVINSGVTPYAWDATVRVACGHVVRIVTTEANVAHMRRQESRMRLVLNGSAS